MAKLYIGLDIGGTKCAASLARADEGVHFLGRREFPTGNTGPEQVLARFLDEIGTLLAAAGLRMEDVSGIGISCGGPLDSRRGVIQSPPNLPGWDDVEIVSFFESRTGLPATLQNDANACAVAEWKFGAGRGCRSMVFLTFGTGLGAGLILDGKLYAGASDMAGEIGHVRLARRGPVGYGKAGSAEGFCSGGGLKQLGIAAVERSLRRGETPRLLEAAGAKENISARLIAQLARDEGDPLCRGIYRDCGARLGETLSVLVDVLNPERIVLGGIFMRSADLLIPSMERVLRRESLPRAREAVQIVPAGLGESIGDCAAIAIASGVC